MIVLTNFKALICWLMIVRQPNVAATFSARQKQLSTTVAWSTCKMLMTTTVRTIEILSQITGVFTLWKMYHKLQFQYFTASILKNCYTMHAAMRSFPILSSLPREHGPLVCNV